MSAPASTQPSTPKSNVKAKKQDKKSKAPSTAPKKVANHPSFIDMIVEAVKELNERHGSSKLAVAKFIKSKYPVDIQSSKTYINSGFKKCLKSGQLRQASGKGLTGSFKLGEVAKKVKDNKPKAAKKSLLKAKKPGSAKTKVVNC
jgi:histone H1/5